MRHFLHRACFVFFVWLAWPLLAQAQLDISLSTARSTSTGWLSAPLKSQPSLVRQHWGSRHLTPMTSKDTGVSRSEPLGVVRQAHHFDEKSTANDIFLFGILPLLGVGALVATVGNIVAMCCSKQDRIAWGSVGIIFSTLTILGLVPFFAEEGALLTLIPLVPALGLLALSIVNLVLAHQPTKTSTQKTKQSKTPANQVSVEVLPWVATSTNASVQGGLLFVGRF